MKTLIKALDATCTCGCKGSDPWHQTHYKRVVRGITETRKDLGDGRFSIAVGTARFPWGVETVRRVSRVLDGREFVIGWEIVKYRLHYGP